MGEGGGDKGAPKQEYVHLRRSSLVFLKLKTIIFIYSSHLEK
jgi:hypothetical protein